MRRLVVVLLPVVLVLGACGGGSKKASGDCFEVWNASSNHSRQAAVAERFTIASVSPWQAQASGMLSLAGQASHGCGYLFHNAKRYLSISAERRDHLIRWDAPPTIHGPWSAQQQAAVRDNAAVDARGRLSRR